MSWFAQALTRHWPTNQRLHGLYASCPLYVAPLSLQQPQLSSHQIRQWLRTLPSPNLYPVILLHNLYLWTSLTIHLLIINKYTQANWEKPLVFQLLAPFPPMFWFPQYFWQVYASVCSQPLQDVFPDSVQVVCMRRCAGRCFTTLCQNLNPVPVPTTSVPFHQFPLVTIHQACADKHLLVAHQYLHRSS